MKSSSLWFLVLAAVCSAAVSKPKDPPAFFREISAGAAITIAAPKLPINFILQNKIIYAPGFQAGYALGYKRIALNLEGEFANYPVGAVDYMGADLLYSDLSGVSVTTGSACMSARLRVWGPMYARAGAGAGLLLSRFNFASNALSAKPSKLFTTVSGGLDVDLLGQQGGSFSLLLRLAGKVPSLKLYSVGIMNAAQNNGFVQFLNLSNPQLDLSILVSKRSAKKKTITAQRAAVDTDPYSEWKENTGTDSRQAPPPTLEPAWKGTAPTQAPAPTATAPSLEPAWQGAASVQKPDTIAVSTLAEPTAKTTAAAPRLDTIPAPAAPKPTPKTALAVQPPVSPPPAPLEKPKPEPVDSVKLVRQLASKVDSLDAVFERMRADSAAAMDSLDKFYAIPPKDAFERTADFEARKARFKLQKDNVLAEKRRSLSARIQAARAAKSSTEMTIGKITSSIRSKQFSAQKLQLGAYNADQGFFPVSLSLQEGYFEFDFSGKLLMPPAAAKALYANQGSGAFVVAYRNQALSISPATDRFVHYQGMRLLFRGKRYELKGEFTLPQSILGSAGWKAEELRKKRVAARTGKPEAQYILGLAYLEEAATSGHLDSAVAWLNRSANQDYTKALVKLASMYFDGLGVKRDYKSAAKYFGFLANLGDADAQYSMSLIYEKGGYGMASDKSTADFWLRAAAKKGNTKAQAKIARIEAAKQAEAEKRLQWEKDRQEEELKLKKKKRK